MTFQTKSIMKESPSDLKSAFLFFTPLSIPLVFPCRRHSENSKPFPKSKLTFDMFEQLNKSAQRREIFDTLLHPRDIAHKILKYSGDLLAFTSDFDASMRNIFISQLISSGDFLVWSLLPWRQAWDNGAGDMIWRASVKLCFVESFVLSSVTFASQHNSPRITIISVLYPRSIKHFIGTWKKEKRSELRPDSIESNCDCVVLLAFVFMKSHKNSLEIRISCLFHVQKT